MNILAVTYMIGNSKNCNNCFNAVVHYVKHCFNGNEYIGIYKFNQLNHSVIIIKLFTHISIFNTKLFWIMYCDNIILNE